MKPRSAALLPAGALAEACAAMECADWARAVCCLRSIPDEAASPENLEDLWQSLRNAGNLPEALRAAEEAFNRYRKKGDVRSAARMAISLGMESISGADDRDTGNGWLLRARRLLADLDPGPEHAWLAVWEGHLAFLFDERLDEGIAHLDRAIALARQFGITDVEILGLALEGLTRVARGDVAAGMSRLDEALTAALGGEVEDLEAVGNASCYLLRACEQIRDFDRAARWCERVHAYFDRLRISRSLTYCRIHYATIRIAQGQWPHAEQELELYCSEMRTMSPGAIEEGRVRLAELRRRQGRFAEAEELLAAATPSVSALLVRAALDLDLGEFQETVEAVRRYFRRISPGDRMQRLPGLEILIPALCRLGRLDEAEEALAELRGTGATTQTSGVQALVARAGGWLAAARNEGAAALRFFEDAVDLYEKARSPYESGKARMELAEQLDEAGRRGAAQREVRAALADFDRIGATLEAARARGVLDQLDREPAETTGEVPGPSAPGLTPRQRDVLRLVAEGLSNREIGERLFLSPHTVKRHIADILTRLDLPTRAAAAAYATERGLTERSRLR